MKRLWHEQGGTIMRSSPIIIGILTTVMCISFAWAREQMPKDTGQKILVKQLTEGNQQSRQPANMQKDEKPSKESIAFPVYKPPKRGAPGGRVGGATRGDHEAYLIVEILAPERIRGLTSHDQPELYWYISKPTDTPIEFTLIDEEAIEPLIEVRIPQPAMSGMQRIRLSDYGIHLKKDKMYRWSIALVLDPERRSKDIVAGARIEQALASEIPRDKLAGADLLQATYINAEAGLWYDAIGSISQAIQADPHQSRYHEVRAALLDQVGLGEIANSDRKRMAADF